MEPLPKCPCCGAKAIVIEVKAAYYYVQCDSCGMRTNSYPTREAAILAWSTRNSIPPAAPTEVSSGGVAGAAEGVRVLEWKAKPTAYEGDTLQMKWDGTWWSRNNRPDGTWTTWKYVGMSLTIDGAWRELFGPELAAVIGEVGNG